MLETFPTRIDSYLIDPSATTALPLRYNPFLQTDDVLIIVRPEEKAASHFKNSAVISTSAGFIEDIILPHFASVSVV